MLLRLAQDLFLPNTSRFTISHHPTFKLYTISDTNKKVKVKFALEQAMKAPKGE
jgi:hypothetical protein